MKKNEKNSAAKAETGSRNPAGTRKKKASTAIEAEIATASQEERKSGTAVIQLSRAPRKLTAEAHRWFMNPNAIPGAGAPPYRYVGWDLVDEVFELNGGKQLELAEVQLFVYRDGPQVVCSADKRNFQPVCYARGIQADGDADEEIKRRKKLTDPIIGLVTLSDEQKEKLTKAGILLCNHLVNGQNELATLGFQPDEIKKAVEEAEEALRKTRSLFHYGGAFYSHVKVQGGKTLAFSGCIFNSRGEYALGSPLFLAAKAYGQKLYGKMKKHPPLVYGQTLDVIKQIHQKIAERRQQQKREAGLNEFHRRRDTINELFGVTDPKSTAQRKEGPATVLHTSDPKNANGFNNVAFQEIDLTKTKVNGNGGH